MSKRATGRPCLLHVLGPDASPVTIARLVDVANGLGGDFTHRVAVDPDASLPSGFAPGVKVSFELDFPPMSGLPTPRKLMQLARALAAGDCILTYGRGALNAALGHTLYGEHLGLPALIHHEDGGDLGDGLRATWGRRIGLGKAAGLVVPDERLEGVALTRWQQPLGRVKQIADGIDTAAYAKPVQPNALPRTLKRPGELWVGCLARFASSERIPMLVRAFAELTENWHLVLLGEGEGRGVVDAEIDRLALNDRVHIRPSPTEPAKVLGLFDIYASAGLPTQYPSPIMQAMAAAIPVAGIALGEGAALLADENDQYVAREGGEAELAQALVDLSFDDGLRARIGEANRARARRDHDRARMIAGYRRLYSSAVDARARRA